MHVQYGTSKDLLRASSYGTEVSLEKVTLLGYFCKKTKNPTYGGKVSKKNGEVGILSNPEK